MRHQGERIHFMTRLLNVCLLISDKKHPKFGTVSDTSFLNTANTFTVHHTSICLQKKHVEKQGCLCALYFHLHTCSHTSYLCLQKTNLQMYYFPIRGWISHQSKPPEVMLKQNASNPILLWDLQQRNTNHSPPNQ